MESLCEKAGSQGDMFTVRRLRFNSGSEVDRAVPCPPTDGLVPWRARCYKCRPSRVALASPAERPSHHETFQRLSFPSTRTPRSTEFTRTLAAVDRQRAQGGFEPDCGYRKRA